MINKSIQQTIVGLVLYIRVMIITKLNLVYYDSCISHIISYAIMDNKLDNHTVVRMFDSHQMSHT